MLKTRQARGGTDRVARIVRRTRLFMGLESFLRAFWPAGCLLLALWSALAFGAAAQATRAQILIAGALAALAFLLLLWQGARRFRWPRRQAARARVDATLPGHPLEALRDSPAGDVSDPQVAAVWEAHLSRMRRVAEGARATPPDLRLAGSDPWALRLMALVLFLAALVFARGDAVENVTTALNSAEAGAVAAAGPGFEGWAEPPLHTGRPTLYLPALSGGGPLAVPEGTQVTLRVYGDQESFSLEEGVSGSTATVLTPAADGIGSAEFAVTGDGAVVLTRKGRELARWDFVAEEDLAPVIVVAGEVERAPDGAMRLPFEALDDFGVTGGQAVIRLDPEKLDRRFGLAAEPEPREDIEVALPLPLTGAATEVAEILTEDFSRHPWAGLPVLIELRAEDAAGQEGTARTATDVLPGRRFYHPLAAALVEQRRDLLWSLDNTPRVVRVLRALTWQPDDLIADDPGAWLMLRTAIRRLAAADETGQAGTAREEIAEALWKVALKLEEGGLGDAAEQLARARERLAEALRQNAPDDEIAQLMDELREATRNYMEQMAREALERGEQQSAQAQPPGQEMTQDQIQQLMDRIQELSEQGRKAEAEAMLEMLQQLLDNMEMQITEGGGGGEQGSGQSMQGMADALREQQGLADESFRQLQREFREGRDGGEGQGEGQQQGEGETPGSGELARRQEALRQLTEDLPDGLPGAAGEGVSEALREAERSMQGARDALEDGDTAGALDRQAEAIDNLREGMQQLSEDVREAAGGGEGEGEQGEQDGGQAGRNTDPLGRESGTAGNYGTDRNMLPGADAGARAREILDEIRRRAGDRSRPEIELDYLRRLLDRF